jgi:acyl dehydratase
MPVTVGDAIPNWTLESVQPERMRTVAAILRDPNPVHWDRAAVAARGGGDRAINQSPLNLAYLANMLMEWAGPRCIRRLRVRFPGVVREGDRVTAGGVVRGLSRQAGVLLAECEVWLDVQGSPRAVEGTALVGLPEETVSSADGQP